LLNGMRHIDLLAERFGASRVLGGLCVISVVLTPEGVIDHLNESHDLAFGELPGARSSSIESVASALLGAGFDSRLSTAILQEMWEKWVFIATMAGMTCLMRAAVGDIVAAGATDLVTALLDECSATASGQGFAPSAAALERMRAMMTMPGSTLMASMLRDIERGSPIEGEHILGDLLRRGKEAPLLRVAYAHVKAYEARRAREGHLGFPPALTRASAGRSRARSRRSSRA
jgi:2-dehydropantoate 2-reductase